MNKLASYNFIQAYCHSIDLFIIPLKQFGVTYFSFSRVYKDGSILFLCSDQNWLKIKFDHNIFEYNGFFPEEVSIINNYDKYLFTGGIDKNNHLMELFFENNKWNSIDLYDRHMDYIDIGHFGSTRDNTGILNFYINKLDILQNAFYSFKIKFDNIINDFINKGLYLNFTQLGEANLDHRINNHLFLTGNKNFIDKANFFKIERMQEMISIIKNTPIITLGGKRISLTLRESECLLLLSKGKTLKEIGKLLNISSRTVEAYINNIKIKTNLHCKSGLIDLYYNSFGKYKNN